MPDGIWTRAGAVGLLGEYAAACNAETGAKKELERVPPTSPNAVELVCRFTAAHHARKKLEQRINRLWRERRERAS